MRPGAIGLLAFLAALALAVAATRQTQRREDDAGTHQNAALLSSTAARLDLLVADLRRAAEVAVALGDLPASRRAEVVSELLSGDASTPDLRLLVGGDDGSITALGADGQSDLWAGEPQEGSADDSTSLDGPSSGADGTLALTLWRRAGASQGGATVPWSAALSAAGLDDRSLGGLEFRLTRRDPGGATVLVRSSELPWAAAARREMAVANRTWTLELGHPPAARSAPVVAAIGVLVSTVLGLVAFALARRPESLRAEATLAAGAAAHEREVLLRRLAELGREDERLRAEFFHDRRTGLPTRAYFLSRLEAALAGQQRSPAKALALLLVSLGNLRSLVDVVGQDAADVLLREVGRRVGADLGPNDLAGRISEEELGVLVTGGRREDAALSAARRLQLALSAAVDLDGTPVYLKPAIGIAHSDQGLEAPTELLAHADLALHRALREPGAVAEYAAAMRDEVVSVRMLESDLRAAIAARDLIPHLQPIVELETAEIVGFEALVRWQSPHEGLISPGRFLPLAEDTGLVVDIDRLMLRSVCELARSWLDGGLVRPFYISVNLSARHILQEDAAAFIGATLAATGLPPAYLRLEITESATIGNFAAALEQTRRLKALGLKLMLDDFGTGYSSLSYLHRFEFDGMKIDASFVRKMVTDDIHRSIVRTVLHLAEDLDLSAVAEGVETEAERAALGAMKCPFAQGYLFGRPMAADLAEQRLRGRL